MKLCYGVNMGVCQLKSRGFIPCEGILRQTGDHSVLHHHTIQSGTQLVAQRFVLIQHNDPKHSSKLCQRYIKRKWEQHVFQLMSRPVQPVDLNPIELVWDELD